VLRLSCSTIADGDVCEIIAGRFSWLARPRSGGRAVQLIGGGCRPKPHGHPTKPALVRSCSVEIGSSASPHISATCPAIDSIAKTPDLAALYSGNSALRSDQFTPFSKTAGKARRREQSRPPFQLLLLPQPRQRCPFLSIKSAVTVLTKHGLFALPCWSTVIIVNIARVSESSGLSSRVGMNDRKRAGSRAGWIACCCAKAL